MFQRRTSNASTGRFILLAVALWLASGAGRVYAAAMVRMSVVIGNNQGLSEENPLQYATRDAEQVDAALMQLGGVNKGNGYLLLDPNVAAARQALQTVKERIDAMHARGEKVQLLVYFSGHGSGEALHMNGEKLPLSEIRAYFKDVQADLKLLIADACYSGSLIQPKGAVLADPVPITYADELKVNGSAILTSSSAGELSQESRELRGSLFTHYFISAIRGAADFDHDGQVTLWEAYNHTKAGLNHKLAGSQEISQTPAFDVDIKGSDNVVLTRLDPGQASLVLSGVPRGEYRILEAVNALQVAEVFVEDDQGMTLALPRDSYLVYHVEGNQSEVGYADLRRERRIALGPRDMRPSGAGSLTAKGLAAKGARSFASRGLFGLSLEPRLYSEFPGRGRSAWAWSASLQSRWEDWSVSADYALLQPYHGGGAGNRLDQSAQGLALEARWYWAYTRLGAAFVAPRLEGWQVNQQVNGVRFKDGQLLGAFAGAGLEKNLARSFSAEFAAQAGAFMGRGGPARFALPLSMCLRYGL